MTAMVVGGTGESGSSAPALDDAAPVLVRRYMHWGYWYHHYRHRAGPYFKGPNVDQGFYDFLIRLPLLKSSLKPSDRPPMVIVLHARGGDFTRHERGWSDHVVLTPDDNTTGVGHSGWFGYHERAPKPPVPDTAIVPYTHRRLIHYVRFAVKTFNVDAHRIWITGGSMGGSGALLFALHHPEWVIGAAADKPPIDLRALPGLRAMAEQSLGPMEWNLKVVGTDVSAWQYTSITWLLSRQSHGRTWIDIHHGRRDTVVPFEQYQTSLSPPGQSFLQRFAYGAVPGVFSWDSGTHERPDPAGGWASDFRPLGTGLIRMDRPTLAFFNPSAGHFGVPDGSDHWQAGRRPERDPRGTINGFCRWGDDLVDRPERFEVSLWLGDDRPEREQGLPDEVTYSVSPRGTHRFPIPPRCRFRYQVDPDGPRGRTNSDEYGHLVVDGVPFRRGRQKAVRLCIEHDTDLPVVAVISPTHPSVVPRAPTTAVVRWSIANGSPQDPRPVDRYRCWISTDPNTAPPADCETPQTERVFESLQPGRYHVRVQARLVDGRWGPTTASVIHVDPDSPVP